MRYEKHNSDLHASRAYVRLLFSCQNSSQNQFQLRAAVLFKTEKVHCTQLKLIFSVLAIGTRSPVNTQFVAQIQGQKRFSFTCVRLVFSEWRPPKSSVIFISNVPPPQGPQKKLISFLRVDKWCFQRFFVDCCSWCQSLGPKQRPIELFGSVLLSIPSSFQTYCVPVHRESVIFLFTRFVLLLFLLKKGETCTGKLPCFFAPREGFFTGDLPGLFSSPARIFFFGTLKGFFINP